MQKKIIFLSTVITLFLVVLFLDENNTAVPVKIILGDPRPIGLSTVIVTSMLVGVVLSVVTMLIFKRLRKTNKNQ